MRSIARSAGVDPALVTHYFGSKEQLFLATAELPFDMVTALPDLLEPGLEGIGERVATFLLDAMDEPPGRAVVRAVVRAGVSNPAATELLRDLVVGRIFRPLARALDVPDADLRATLVGAQMVGIITARYIAGVEPLASLPRGRLARVLAPTLERYLVGELEA
jgi:AcrR family transcriptional regulator